MIHKESIRARLFKLLFTNPRPISPEEYAKERYFIFPGETIFQDFLRTDDHQIRIDLSKKILLRLVYHHSFPVPSKLLFNLLEMQIRDVPVVEDGDYIAQDHFVHLVNLYLLGIYLFSYHKGLHNSCIRDLNRLRRIAKKDSNISSYNVNLYRLFSILWAQFILYHDVAYPLERIKPDHRESFSDLFSVFQEIEKYVREDISIKSLSKIIAIKSIISDINITTFNNLYTKYHNIYTVTQNGRKIVRFTKDESTEDDNKEDEFNKYNNHLKTWARALYLPSVDGIRSLKMIMSFFPPNSIGAVLEQIDVGQPLAFATFGQKEVIIFDDIEPRNPVISKRNLWESAFENMMPLSSNYSWNYFVLDPNLFFDKVKHSLFGYSVSKLNVLLKNFEEDEEFQKLKRLEVDSADDLGFYCYYKLFSTLNYREFNEELSSLEKELHIIKKANEKLSIKIPAISGERIGKWLSNKHRDSLEVIKNDPSAYTDKLFLPNTILEEGVNHLATYAMNYICKNKLPIKKKLIEDYEKKIYEPLELYQSCEQCVKYICKDNLDDSFQLSSRSNIFNPFGELDFNKNFDLSEAIFEKESHLSKIDDYISLHMGNIKASELINSYKASWAQIESNGFLEGGFIDHGFAACIVLLAANSIHSEICKDIGAFDKKQDMTNKVGSKIFGNDNCSVPAEIRHLWLNYGLTSKNDIALLNLQLELLGTEVANSIFLHNFYPADAPKGLRDYRTNRNNQPFPYLAFLCDGIQRWDRKKFVNQAKIDIKDITPGSLYNIIIKGNIIELHVPVTSIDRETSDREIANDLEKYLRGIKSFIEIKQIQI